MYWEFVPGDRVVTSEGLPGVVTEVETSFAGGNEAYTVLLDDDLGGGSYAADELTKIARKQADHDFGEPETIASLGEFALDSDSDIWMTQDGKMFDLVGRVEKIDGLLNPVFLDEDGRPKTWGRPIRSTDPQEVLSGFVQQYRERTASRKEASYMVVDDGGFIVAGPFTSRFDAEEARDALQSEDPENYPFLYIEREGAKEAKTANRVCDWCGLPARWTSRGSSEDGTAMIGESWFACDDHRGNLPQTEIRSIGNSLMGYPEDDSMNDESDEGAGTYAIEEPEDEIISTAADDYPELGDILVERPPLPHSLKVSRRKRAMVPQDNANALRREWNNLVSEYGDQGWGKPLREWELVLRGDQGQAGSRAIGYTHFPTSKVTIVSWAMEQYPLDHLIDTLRHEVAHVIAGPQAGHGPQWRAWAMKVGADPQATSSHGGVGGLIDPGYSYFGVCPNHGVVSGWFRKPKRDQLRCGLCYSQILITDDWDAVYEFGYDKTASRKAEGKTANWFVDKVLYPLADAFNKGLPEESRYNFETGEMASYDWCRWRKNRRCYYPIALNEAATAEAGYNIWVPQDRGFCPRDPWEAQKDCPMSEPGPNAPPPDRPLAWGWIPWEQGGQRYDPYGKPITPPGF